MTDSPDEFRKLTARDVMQTNVITVSSSSPLSELERLLGEYRIGGMPVTDEAGHIIGIVSMRDLLERYSQDQDSHPRRGPGYFKLSAGEMQEDIEAFETPAEGEQTVAEIMSSDVVSVPAATVLPVISAKLIEHQIHRLLVANDGRYVGLITTFDLLRAVTP